MKKVLIVLLLTLMSVGAFAQQGNISGHIKGGVQFDPTRFGIGAEGRYGLTENIRAAADVLIFLPKHKTWGLDINANIHYVFELKDGISVYPLAGLNVANNRGKYDTIDSSNPLNPEVKKKSVGTTDFGFNLGAGVDYALNEKNYLNAEFKYTFNDWDYAQLMFGYGFRF